MKQTSVRIAVRKYQLCMLEREEGYEKTYGTGGTTDALREAIYGGAQKLVAFRIGSGGTNETVSLDVENGKVKIETQYPGEVDFTVTVRSKLADSSRKECIIYKETEEFEKVNFSAGDNEAQALVDALAKSKNFTATLEENGSGTISDVSQKKFTGGADPSVTNADYSRACPAGIMADVGGRNYYHHVADSDYLCCLPEIYSVGYCRRSSERIGGSYEESKWLDLV